MSKAPAFYASQQTQRNYLRRREVFAQHGLFATLVSLYECFMLNLQTRRNSPPFRNLKFSILIPPRDIFNA